MPESVQLQLEVAAIAAVERACCGGDHELGECPHQTEENQS